jgi:5-methyltetrahydrofolate--homocysteine methyltransferase
MKTILRSESQEVQIDIEGPFVLIGEKINPTGRQKLASALEEGDLEYVRVLARRQVEAGADVLDVNVGLPGLDEVDLLPRVIEIVSAEVETPICIDTPDSDALAEALKVAKGRPLVNSVNGEEASLQAVLPLVKEHDVPVIGLTMDDEGIPMDADTRVAIAGKIIERAAKHGIATEDVVIDPLAMAVGADSKAGIVTLESIRRIRQEFGVNITMGASNVSFGLPDRHTVNRAFLALAIGAGATCAIGDAAKLTLAIRAIDLLRGVDDYGARYIKHFRAMTKKS